ncbi:MAG: hypothetical protein IJN90_07635 [Bacilli bacterium]|nr:hypothetical protein [Bacilli bacterium]
MKNMRLGDDVMSDVKDEVLEVFEVLEESIKNYTPDNNEELERIEKIKNYLNDNEIKTE